MKEGRETNEVSSTMVLASSPERVFRSWDREEEPRWSPVMSRAEASDDHDGWSSQDTAPERRAQSRERNLERTEGLASVVGTL